MSIFTLLTASVFTTDMFSNTLLPCSGQKVCTLPTSPAMANIVQILLPYTCVFLAAHFLRALEAYHAALARSHLQDSYDQFGRPIFFF
jgi:hypothetical protein